jgi:hypothetical protein
MFFVVAVSKIGGVGTRSSIHRGFVEDHSDRGQSEGRAEGSLGNAGRKWASLIVHNDFFTTYHPSLKPITPVASATAFFAALASSTEENRVAFSIFGDQINVA